MVLMLLGDHNHQGLVGDHPVYQLVDHRVYFHRSSRSRDQASRNRNGAFQVCPILVSRDEAYRDVVSLASFLPKRIVLVITHDS